MATRHQARLGVVALLYANEFAPQSSEAVEEFLASKRLKNEQKAFALGLLDGVRANLARIDEALSEFMDEQSKVGAVEKAILRLAAYEFTHSDTDKAVIINEAIELGKELGSENAPKFINAVLDKLKGVEK